MTFALTGLQPVILESQTAMNAVDGATIERRIRINRPDEGSARCKGSRAWDPRKDFSQCMAFVSGDCVAATDDAGHASLVIRHNRMLRSCSHQE
jgi:hypothetical protein